MAIDLFSDCIDHLPPVTVSREAAEVAVEVLRAIDAEDDHAQAIVDTLDAVDGFPHPPTTKAS